MTPARSDDLTPVLFKDFSGGLWERGSDRECPSNGLLEAQDCMPLPSGGLRAAWAWTEENTGANVPRERRVVGFNLWRDPNSASETVYTAVMLASSVAGVFGITYEHWGARGLRSSGGGGVPPTDNLTNGTTWSSGRRHSSMSGFRPVRFIPFADSTARSWYYNVAYGAGGGQTGIFKYSNLGDTASTSIAGIINPAYLTAHQDRLIYAVERDVNNTQWYRLIFTNPSTDTAPPSSNFLDVGTYKDGHIDYMESFYPNDLFVMKRNQAIFSIQGDLGSGPAVREVAVGHLPEQVSWGTRIPGGVAYMTEREGVWLWAGGSQAQHISPQFNGTPMTTRILRRDTIQGIGQGFLGSLGYGGRWMFTPLGYVYDCDHNWWFRVSLPGTRVYSHWAFDDIRGRMYGAGHVEPQSDFKIISASLADAGVRASTFQATLPIIDTTERNVELRRIEIFGQGFGNGGTWQLELSNDKGQTETTDPLQVQARAASVRANTKLQGDWLKVRLLSEGHADASSSTGKSEAPMVERIVLYLRSRQTRAA